MPNRNLQLARVVIDLDYRSARAARMNPEKSRVECTQEFTDAAREARADDGTTFSTYLDTARQALKQANQRTRTRTPIVPVGRGLPPRVRQVVERELDSVPGHDEVDIRWREMSGDGFFEVDRASNTLWLNSHYRGAVVGDRNAGLNDAPLVKTMLFVLVEPLFHGSWWGTKDKDNLEVWQALLTAAAKEELPS